jgi:hypothetical protein
VVLKFQVDERRWKKDASKASKVPYKQGKDATYDCAFLEPLAFPPDLPPVILMDLDLFGGER